MAQLPPRPIASENHQPHCLQTQEGSYFRKIKMAHDGLAARSTATEAIASDNQPRCPHTQEGSYFSGIRMAHDGLAERSTATEAIALK